ncbi:hypothetical protein GMORB2_4844 [Geosmithia morbida]|uniref:Uncharacterized protein n=1 Tax=Geosmithia morbida TaxID=1094350 RepID=A0A9P4YMJ1_9HYPO|nr:uncharacterized protein GMORB2_4844 [Geosmithia morbida]KAF4119325.1 hypothetical protein GMORB2_4844 [Geosmithia morbida]
MRGVGSVPVCLPACQQSCAQPASVPPPSRHDFSSLTWLSLPSDACPGSIRPAAHASAILGLRLVGVERCFHRTRNFSLPPEYNYEGAPPVYQDANRTESGGLTKKGKAKARKVTFIRIMASVVVVSTVALIVGGVASKIDAMKSDEREGSSSRSAPKPAATPTHDPDIVVMPSHPSAPAATSALSPMQESALIVDGSRADNPDNESDEDGHGSLPPRCDDISCATTEQPEDCTAWQFAHFMSEFCLSDTELFSDNSE